MIIKIHDLPVKYPMEGVSFHATKDPIDRIWWKDGILEIVTSTGEVWRLDFDSYQWTHAETLGV